MEKYEAMYQDMLTTGFSLSHSIRYTKIPLHANGVCCHPECKQSVYMCKDCLQIVCPSLRCTKVYMIMQNNKVSNHQVCYDCKSIVTCRLSQLCHSCAPKHAYDKITEHLAVGGYSASYAPFDIIVNLDYPENDAQLHDIRIRHVRKNACVREDPSTDPKPMIICGFYDSPTEFDPRIIYKILSCLSEESKRFIIDKRRLPNILIHCAAGISRSSTIAIAYLSELTGITHQEAYDMIKVKRPMIRPNEGFRKLLGISLT